MNIAAPSRTKKRNSYIPIDSLKQHFGIKREHFHSFIFPVTPSNFQAESSSKITTAAALTPKVEFLCALSASKSSRQAGGGGEEGQKQTFCDAFELSDIAEV